MGTTFKNRDWTIPWRNAKTGKRHNWLGMRFGVEKHRIWNDALTVAYQDRFMLCLGPIEVRLHKFWRGDDYRAPHDHPWWFITFPFANYLELVPVAGSIGYFEEDRDWWAYTTNIVKRFRFHYRPPGYKHIVVRRYDKKALENMLATMQYDKPFWTFVITGRKTREWGFWKTPKEFIHHAEWHGK